MKQFLIFLLTSIAIVGHAQNNSESNFERKGFVFGASLGASYMSLNFHSHPRQTEMSASFPNIKAGAMISSRTALLLVLPGSIYTYDIEGRSRDRGFEGIVPSVQYWFSDRWWVLGGIGLGMDAPAFYDIESEDERKFYFGTALIAGVGYEVWRERKFALDVQSRIHLGTASRPEGKFRGTAFDVLVGFNWY
jgi:hypothetical protein